MDTDDIWLVVAIALGVAAYIYLEDEPYAPLSSGSGTVPSSGNGFAINNPGNIRYISSNPFVGQTGKSASGFGVYDTLGDGVGAMFKLLTTYHNRGKRTVTDIISTWAPSSENNTSAYISAVSDQMGVAADEPLDWPGDAVPLIQAIAYHENGYNPMSESQVHGYIHA